MNENRLEDRKVISHEKQNRDDVKPAGKTTIARVRTQWCLNVLTFLTIEAHSDGGIIDGTLIGLLCNITLSSTSPRNFWFNF